MSGLTPTIVPRALRALAAVHALTALGIFAFWVHWFVSGAIVLAGDTCFLVFENSFPLPDCVTGIFLVLTATALWRGADTALLMGCYASGMVLQLVSLDLLYHWQHDGFHPWGDPSAMQRLFIVVYGYLFAAGTLAVLWRMRRILLADAFALPPLRLRFPVGMISVALVAFFFGMAVVAYWTVHLGWLSTPGESCGDLFHDAFLLADALTFAACWGTTYGILARRSWALASGLTGCGGITFGACIWFSFAMIHPNEIEGRITSYIVFVSFLFAATASIASFLWTQRDWFMRLSSRPQ